MTIRTCFAFERCRPVKKWIVTALLLPGIALAAGNEQRCDGLGTACVCSETLNVSANLPAEPDRHWNPPNTTTKECDGENGDGSAITMPADYSLSAQVLASAAGGVFPSGANPFVYRGKLSGIQHFISDSTFGVNEETVCHRTYRRYSSDMPPPPDFSYRVKNIQLGAGFSLPGMHANIEHYPDGTGNAYATYVDPEYSSPDISAYPQNFHQKCQAGWCRLEICADQIGTHMTYRTRIVYLATGETFNSSNDAGEGPTAKDFNANWAQMFVQGSLPGSQFMSHTMLARVPANQNFWIGAACELEGGCGGTPLPPPPPPPTAPPAPVLLP